MPCSDSRWAADKRRRWIALAAFMAGLSLPHTARAQCEPSFCTGDAGARMCGFPELVETGSGCNLNNCQKPTFSGPRFAFTIGTDPDGKPQLKAQMIVPITAPWNNWANDRDRNPNASPNGTLDVLWYENAATAPEPWAGLPSGVRTSICEDTEHDKVETWVELPVTCAALRSGSSRVYSLRAMTCGGPCPPPFYPNCSPFCGRWEDLNGLDFRPPEEDVNRVCPKTHTCSCGQGLQAGGSCPTGGGPDQTADGPGAILRYSAGGIGAPGTPGASLWVPQLGRYWSHDYAERLVPGEDSRQLWLITAEAIYRGFWDMNGDGDYELTYPEDDERRLRRTASGWELISLDGTTMSFDADGRWTQTSDPHGNRKLASYSGGVLSRVEMPDGRSETFSYHPSGKLAAIDEIGVDGTTTRTWRYTWQGDDLVRIDRPDGTARAFRYDDSAHPGYMTRRTLLGTDGSERIERAWEYDAHGNVTRTWEGAADPAGGVDLHLFAYTDPKNPTEATVTDPMGVTSSYRYQRDPSTNKPLLLSNSGDCPTCGTGPNSQITYGDPANPLLKTRVADGRGTVTLYTYNAKGRMTSRTEASGTPLQRTTTWEYNGPFPSLVTAMEQPSTSGTGSRRTLYTYDPQGSLLTQTLEGVEAGSAFSLTTTNRYSDAGQIEEVNPPGYGTADATSFTYDPARGNLIPSSRIDPLIGETRFTHDAWNRRAAVIDRNGVRTVTVYDDLNRVVQVTQEGPTPEESLTTRYEHNAFGDLARTILPAGNIIEYSYDAAGRLISIERKPNRTSSGERTFYTLDSFGHRIREDLQRWDGLTWVTDSFTGYVYSTRCHLSQTIHADGSTTEYTYDCNGNLERTWDANHPSDNGVNPATMIYEYDVLDRETVVRQPWKGAGGGEAVTRYGYDVQDHLVQVTDAEGNVTRYTYSDRDLMTRQVSEVSGTTEYRYNEHGELTTETDARGITVTRTVDVLDRLAFTDYPEDALDTRFTYDDPLVPFSKGRLTAIIRNGGTVAYRYDRFGRLLQDGALTYDYDLNGNRKEIGYPGGVTATYDFDFADRERRLTLIEPGQAPKTVASDAEYLAGGPLTSLLLGNGLVESRIFDERYFPSTIRVPGRLNWQYTTDDVGNILSIQDALDPAKPRQYTYQDVSYFLLEGDGPWGRLSWTYDKIGNRLTQTRDGATETYSYVRNAVGGNNPKLTTVAPPAPASPTSYYYDAAGDQTHQTAGNEKVRFSYNAERRLSQISRDVPSEAPALTRITYDGRGFLKTTTLSPEAGGNFQNRTWATYTSEGLLLHKLSGSRPASSEPRDQAVRDTDSFVLYLANRPVALLETTSLTSGSPPAESRRLLYLSTDHLGTPVLLTEESGNELWEGGFKPFGEDYAHAQDIGLFLRFPGQWEDGSWEDIPLSKGLYYNLHRWYEPAIGRYGQADPLGVESEDFTLYGYALQSPLVNFDPEGLLALAPDSKCKKFDKAKKLLDKLKDNCACKEWFRENLGADLVELIDGPQPVVIVTKDWPAGHTTCDSPRSVEVNPKLCGFGQKKILKHTLLHELAHFADCDQQRFPGDGPKEEGALAEVACFGFTIDRSGVASDLPKPPPWF